MDLQNELQTWAAKHWPADTPRPPSGVWTDKWTAAAFRVRCRVHPGWLFCGMLAYPMEVIRLGPLIGKADGMLPDEWPPDGDDWRGVVRGYMLYEYNLGTQLTPEGEKLARDYMREIEADNARRCKLDRQPFKSKPEPAKQWGDELF